MLDRTVERFPFSRALDFNAVTVSEVFWVVSLDDWCSRSLKPMQKGMLANAVKTGLEVADDVLEGQSFKESAKKRVSAGIKRTVKNHKLAVWIWCQEQKIRGLRDIFS